MPCCMSTTSESQPACAITSAEKLAGMPSQLLTTALPSPQISRMRFARAMNPSIPPRGYRGAIPPATGSEVKRGACADNSLLRPRGNYGCGLAKHFLVDDVIADRLAVEHRQDVLHRHHRHAVDRLAGDAGDVRRRDEVGEGQQRV